MPEEIIKKIGDIAALVVRINEAGKYGAEFSFAGHIRRLDVNVYEKPWSALGVFLAEYRVSFKLYTPEKYLKILSDIEARLVELLGEKVATEVIDAGFKDEVTT